MITKRIVRQKLDDMLAAEVHRCGGIPHLSAEELAFRETIAAYLEQDAADPLLNERFRVCQIATAEFHYWSKHDQIEAMGACANIVTAAFLGQQIGDVEAAIAKRDEKEGSMVTFLLMVLAYLFGRYGPRSFYIGSNEARYKAADCAILLKK